jgi:hypothetical protein
MVNCIVKEVMLGLSVEMYQEGAEVGVVALRRMILLKEMRKV